MPYVDFQDLKSRVSIEQAIQLLGLHLKPAGSQLRGPCPICKTGGDRALVVTPSKGMFFCFVAQTGGDQIALVAHVQACKTNEAASFLSGTGSAQNRTVSKKDATIPPTEAGKRPAFDPAAYVARLDPQHEALAALNLSADTLRHFKAGYAATGSNRGRLAIAVTHQGTTWFVGRAIGQQQPVFAFPNGFPDVAIWNADNVQRGELYVFKDPLDAMRAFELGIENVCAFLTDGATAQQMEALAGLMDARQCERAFF